MSRVTIFPEWGGFKIKVDGRTVAAAPNGDLERAVTLAKIQANNIKENIICLLDKEKNVVREYKV